MPDTPTPDPGKTVPTPDTGKNVTPEQIAEIVKGAIKAELPNAVKAELAPITEQIATVSKTVNSMSATFRRPPPKAKDTQMKAEGDDQSNEQDDTNNAEVASLRDQVKALTDKDASNTKKLALKEALDAINDKIVGRPHIEKLISPDLRINSAGEVIVVIDGKSLSLKEHAATYAADPIYQKPTGTDGAGRPADSAPSKGPQDQKSKTVNLNDPKAVAANFDAIAEGSVTAVSD